MTQQGVLIVISGPSGAGKGTICKELLRSCPNLSYSISATTRQPRTGEIDGVNYWFVAKEQFKSMIEAGELLEWAEVYDNYYGTPRKYVDDLLSAGKDVILEIDIQGAMQIKSRIPAAVFIYIIPPSIEELASRIHKRGTDSLETITKRLNCVMSELKSVNYYNYIVINDDLSIAVEKVKSIIIAEKCKSERNLHIINDLMTCQHG